MIRPDFLFIHTAVVRPWVRQGPGGEIFGEAAKVKCRARIGRTGRRVAAVGEVLGVGGFWLPKGTRLEPGSEIVYGKKVYRVKTCVVAEDFAGENHVEVGV